MKDVYPSRQTEEKILPRVDPVIYDSKKMKDSTLNTDELVEYDRNGFITFSNLFSQDEVAILQKELECLSTDEDLLEKEEFISEPDSNKLRTIFNQHLFSKVFDVISRDKRVLNKAKQLLGGDVYLHHSRINIKPAYKGKSFPWHSDFETWHSEDGLPRCRCLTALIMLTDNTEFNGPLYLIPGSHQHYVSCKGATPDDNYKKSLKKQEYGVPSVDAVKELLKDTNIVGAYGKAGTLVIFDGNVMHGSPDNISPYDRTNAFFVFNSCHNKPEKNTAAKSSRAEFLSLKNTHPLKSS